MTGNRRGGNDASTQCVGGEGEAVYDGGGIALEEGDGEVGPESGRKAELLAPLWKKNRKWKNNPRWVSGQMALGWPEKKRNCFANSFKQIFNLNSKLNFNLKHF
jgi:hypothetical protein